MPFQLCNCAVIMQMLHVVNWLIAVSVVVPSQSSSLVDLHLIYFILHTSFVTLVHAGPLAKDDMEVLPR